MYKSLMTSSCPLPCISGSLDVASFGVPFHSRHNMFRRWGLQKQFYSLDAWNKYSLHSWYSHNVPHGIVKMMTHTSNTQGPSFVDIKSTTLWVSRSLLVVLMEGHQILISEQLSRALRYLTWAVSLLIIFLGFVSFVCPHWGACNLLHY